METKTMAQLLKSLLFGATLSSGYLFLEADGFWWSFFWLLITLGLASYYDQLVITLYKIRESEKKGA